MHSRWPFPDIPEDAPIPTRDLVAIFTVIDLAGWPGDSHIPMPCVIPTVRLANVVSRTRSGPTR